MVMYSPSHIPRMGHSSKGGRRSRDPDLFTKLECAFGARPVSETSFETALEPSETFILSLFE